MKRVMSALQIVCGRTGEENETHEEDEEDGQIRALYDVEDTGDFYWSLALQQDFRFELEKLIILGTFLNTGHGSHTNCTCRLYYTQHRPRSG
jgi:phosphatidylinositol 4-kinase type 2